VMILTAVLVLGIRESAGANTFMVSVKIIAIVISSWPRRAMSRCRTGTLHAQRWQGVLTGGAIVFFTYIGV